MGLLPILGAAAAWILRMRGRRDGVVAAVSLAAVLFTAGLACVGRPGAGRIQVAAPLAEALPMGQLDRDVRLAAYDYFQPSLVFYCRREVLRLATPQDAADHLRSPLESYLFLPAPTWDTIRPTLPVTTRELARHFDLYTHCEIVLVGNNAGHELALKTSRR